MLEQIFSFPSISVCRNWSKKVFSFRFGIFLRICPKLELCEILAFELTLVNTRGLHARIGISKVSLYSRDIFRPKWDFSWIFRSLELDLAFYTLCLSLVTFTNFGPRRSDSCSDGFIEFKMSMLVKIDMWFVCTGFQSYPEGSFDNLNLIEVLVLVHLT